MESVDSLAKLRGEVHAGSRSPPTLGARTWRRVEPGGDTTRRDAAEGKVEVEGRFLNVQCGGKDD